MKKKSKTLSLVLTLAMIMTTGLLTGQGVKKQTSKKFITKKEVWATPEKSQGETGLCAIFSDISFMESELHRMGRGDFELSTMYVAYNLYTEKALRRIRLRGKIDYGFNGNFNYDGFEMIEKYGVVPVSEYSGLLTGQTEHNHFGFLRTMNDYLKGVEKEGKEGNLNSYWADGKFYSTWLEKTRKILNRNMGELPTVIDYDKKAINPIQFSEEILSIPYNDYTKITSYSYIGFDQKGELLVDGNWLHKKDFYNIRLNEYIELIDYALENGFSLTGDFHITLEMYNGKGYVDFQLDSINTNVNQDIRDNLYENWKTNDVHNVHIIGIARDENGKKYYKIKDSAPTNDVFTNPPKYFSEDYFRARVLSVMLHKDGIPLEIRERLKIN